MVQGEAAERIQQAPLESTKTSSLLSPPVIEIKSYKSDVTYIRHDNDPITRDYHETFVWQRGLGGKLLNIQHWYFNHPLCLNTWVIGADGCGIYQSTCAPPHNRCYSPRMENSAQDETLSYPPGNYSVVDDRYIAKVETKLSVHTKGRKIGKSNMRPLLFDAWAFNTTERFTDEFIDGEYVPTSQLQLTDMPNANPDCDGIFLEQLPIKADLVFTMKAPGQYKDYDFNVTVARPPLKRLSHSAHPFAGAGTAPLIDVQENFDIARDFLAADNDPCNPTGSPGADNNDDVNTYLEFEILDPPHVRFPAAFNFNDPIWLTNAVVNFTLEKYWRIDHWDDMFRLNQAKFANVKQVYSIEYDGPLGHEEVVGRAGYSGTPAILFTTSDGNVPVILIHEFGHTAGLQHRDQVMPNGVPNPGNDPMAVMRNSNGAANEVNRTERPAFVGWNKELWMQK
jgi:hypothetical protein